MEPQLGQVNFCAIIDNVSIRNPKAVQLEDLDEAIVGMTAGAHPVFIYSTELCTVVMMRDNDWDWEGANEFLEHNIFHAYYGDYGPVFRYDEDGNEHHVYGFHHEVDREIQEHGLKRYDILSHAPWFPTLPDFVNDEPPDEYNGYRTV